MPPFVRTFILLLVAYPAALFWFLCGFAAMATLGFLLMGSMAPEYWLMFLAFLAACIIAHLIRALAGYVLGDNENRIAGSQIGQRLAWDLAIDVLGIGVAGAGIALAPCLVQGNWGRAAVAVVLFVGLAYLLVHTNRARSAFIDRWLQEHANDALPPS